MYSILAHVTIQPQHVDEYLSLIREHARDSLRDEAGTLGFQVIQDEKDRHGSETWEISLTLVGRFTKSPYNL
jgi:quinol monooxygenase YgiN